MQQVGHCACVWAGCVCGSYSWTDVRVQCESTWIHRNRQRLPFLCELFAANSYLYIVVVIVKRFWIALLRMHRDTHWQRFLPRWWVLSHVNCISQCKVVKLGHQELSSWGYPGGLPIAPMGLHPFLQCAKLGRAPGTDCRGHKLVCRTYEASGKNWSTVSGVISIDQSCMNPLWWLANILNRRNHTATSGPVHTLNFTRAEICDP